MMTEDKAKVEDVSGKEYAPAELLAAAAPLFAAMVAKFSVPPSNLMPIAMQVLRGARQLIDQRDLEVALATDARMRIARVRLTNAAGPKK